MGLNLAGLPRLWDVKGWLYAILSREQHPLLQFIRYGLAGVAAMVANLIAFGVCIQWVFPVPADALAEWEPLSGGATGIVDWMRQIGRDPQVASYVKANTVAFLASNVVAYILNFKWVFQSGRHSRQVEVILFFAVSLFSFLIGTAIASVMVGSFGWNEYVAKISDVVFAILINYLCRKFLVFQN
ncbi:GtrA family protein [Kiritimatiellaeota bacterium B1221]|nr:GtrA family protein [Kiritimatiellaeota bacterium B1221]